MKRTFRAFPVFFIALAVQKADLQAYVFNDLSCLEAIVGESDRAQPLLHSVLLLVQLINFKLSSHHRQFFVMSMLRITANNFVVIRICKCFGHNTEEQVVYGMKSGPNVEP